MQQTFGDSDLPFEAEPFDSAVHQGAAEKSIRDGIGAMLGKEHAYFPEDSFPTAGWIFAGDKENGFQGSVGFRQYEVEEGELPAMNFFNFFVEPGARGRRNGSDIISSRFPKVEVVQTLIAALVSLACAENSRLIFSARQDLPKLARRYSELFGERNLWHEDSHIFSLTHPESGVLLKHILNMYIVRSRSALRKALSEDYLSPRVPLVLKPPA